MADVLLVHGSCHGAWCWSEVLPFLKQMGHDARAIDLPGHGDDTTPVNDVTLDAYAASIAAACRDNTVLVGHSMGGYAITAAAEEVPDRIARLVYLCAYVPEVGKTLSDMRQMAPRQPILAAIDIAPDRRSFCVRRDTARALFYHDCPDASAARAIDLLCPEAVAPAQTVIPLTRASQSLPRRYIRCLDDRTIPPEFQVTMTRSWPAEHVQEMDCSHSPFIADPEGLARRIDHAIRN